MSTTNMVGGTRKALFLCLCNSISYFILQGSLCSVNCWAVSHCCDQSFGSSEAVSVFTTFFYSLGELPFLDVHAFDVFYLLI